MRALLLVLLFGPLYFIALGATGVIDYDEALYAEVSRDMLDRGEYVLPRYNGEAFNHKPPLLYWSQVAGYRVFGVNAFGARAATALAGLLGLLALYGFARGPLGRDRAFLAAFVLGTCLHWVALSRVALTDMQLSTCFIVCLGSLHRAAEAESERWRGLRWFLLACLASALAMLAKGLVGFVLPAGAWFFYLLLLRKPRLLFRPSWLLPGVAILVLIGCSWYLLIALTHPGGMEFMRALFVEQHFERFTQPSDGHSGPVWYYLPVLLVGLMPWSPFLPFGGFRRQAGAAPDAGGRLVLLLTIFSILTFLFFSVSATKLPNYITPALPGLALLIAVGLSKERALAGVRGKIAIGVSAGMFLLFAAALFALPWAVTRAPDWIGRAAEKAPGLRYPVDLGPGPYVAGALLLLGGSVTVLAFVRGRKRVVIGSLGGTSIVLLATLMLFLLPRYDEHFNRPLRRLARQAAELTPKDERVVLLGLRRRPSVIYYGGRPTEETRAGLGGRPLPPVTTERIGISTRTYLREAGLLDRVEIVAEDRGYVLFRVVPGE